ncbi:MAG: hypothetical protein IAG10_17230 [Planctomycetaceae bacterium]|nr:hypothetical protein [Planctomycetaceae bacterium]
MSSTISFSTFPRTEPPPHFVEEIVAVFREAEPGIATLVLDQHRKSDDVLNAVSRGLQILGFDVETGKSANQKISRPVFFGENGQPTLRFEVDAYHKEWRCGLEVEGTRAIRGGALFRDLIQALVMVQVDHLCIAVPNIVEWGQSGRSKCYREATRTAEAIFGHTRFRFPYGLTIIGY